jgi:TolA-binding protein
MRRALFIVCSTSILSTGFCANSKPVTPRHSIVLPVEIQKKLEFDANTYYAKLKECFQEGKHQKVVQICKFIYENFEDEPFFSELPYYMGRSYLFLDDYDLANKQFTKYLRTPGVMHFDEVIKLKFEVGKIYAGKIKAPFHSIRQLVRLPFHNTKAKQIFDEIISLVAFSDLAAYSLFYKGEILNRTGEYEEAIECFNSVIKGFGLHELLPESYLGIADSYLLQYQYSKSKNPDLLDLASLNLQRFEQQFPQSEMKEQLAKRMLSMKEEYALDLYETGRFYERTKKWHAAKMYYDNVLEKFADTTLADKCKKRLTYLEKKLPSAS